MKSFHKLLFGIGVAMTALPVVQAENPTMTVLLNSSDRTSIKLSADTKIRFTEGNSKMQVTDNYGTVKEFELPDIASLQFALYSDIDDVISDVGGLTFACENGIVKIAGAEEIEYIVTDSFGRIVTSGASTESITIDLTTHAPGVYIIIANNKTVKFVNR